MSLFLNKKAVGLEYWPVVVHIFCKANKLICIFWAQLELMYMSTIQVPGHHSGIPSMVISNRQFGHKPIF